MYFLVIQRYFLKKIHYFLFCVKGCLAVEIDIYKQKILFFYKNVLRDHTFILTLRRLVDMIYFINFIIKIYLIYTFNFYYYVINMHFLKVQKYKSQ